MVYSDEGGWRLQAGRRWPTSGCVGGRWRCGLLCQCRAPFGRKIPGQKRLDVFRRLSAGRRTTLQVPRQPQSRIDFPVGQRGQQRKHRRRQPATPQASLSRRSSFAPRPDRDPLVPKRCCPSECADHPRTEPVPTSVLAGSPKPCGTAGGVWHRKVLPPLELASPPPPDATKHLALETSPSRADAANVLD